MFEPLPVFARLYILKRMTPGNDREELAGMLGFDTYEALCAATAGGTVLSEDVMARIRSAFPQAD